MKKEYTELLCCPYCHGDLELEVEKEKNKRSGFLTRRVFCPFERKPSNKPHKERAEGIHLGLGCVEPVRVAKRQKQRADQPAPPLDHGIRHLLTLTLDRIEKPDDEQIGEHDARRAKEDGDKINLAGNRQR